MVLRTSSSEAASEEERSADESIPLDSPRPSPAHQIAQQQHPQTRSPPRTSIEVENGSGPDDDGGTLRIKDLDTGREMQIKQASAHAESAHAHLRATCLQRDACKRSSCLKD